MSGKFYTDCPRGVHEFSGPICDHCGIPYENSKPMAITGRDAVIILRGERIEITGGWSLETRIREADEKFETICAAIEAAKPGDTIYVDSNGGDGMSYQGDLQHARMRFDTMTERKLWNRMGKMSVLSKLQAFAEVADERGFPDMAVAARARYTRMSGGGKIDVAGIPIIRRSESTLKKSSSGRVLRRMDG